MDVEVYRTLVIAIAGFSIALNIFVGVQWSRAWCRSKDKELREALRGPALYPLVAAAVGAVSIYWRLNDNLLDAPYNPGDFTVLVPAVGFLVAAWVSLGNYARVEVLMIRLNYLERTTQGKDKDSE